MSPLPSSSSSQLPQHELNIAHKNHVHSYTSSMATVKASCVVILLSLLLLTAPAASDMMSATMPDIISPSPTSAATSGESSSPPSEECHDECVAKNSWTVLCNLKCYHSIFAKSKKAEPSDASDDSNSPIPSP